LAKYGGTPEQFREKKYRPLKFIDKNYDVIFIKSVLSEFSHMIDFLSQGVLRKLSPLFLN
jgi:hypothetical protein